MAIRFVIDGQPIHLARTEPCLTLLQWLRASGRTAAKEGCAEGECGACAVAIARRDAQGRTRFEAINSCLAPLVTVAGETIVTAEGISPPGGPLHPVQQAMVDEGGSQCGYCTPGFVVSLFCEYYRPGRSGYDPEAISGNLCRCTGYRPIVAAARGMPLPAADDAWLRSPCTAPGAAAAETDAVDAALRPRSLPALFDALASWPGAALLAGGTDLMVYANQRGVRWPAIIAVDAVPELKAFERTPGELTFGAGLPLSHLEEQLAGAEGSGMGLLRQLFPLFSSRLIRNRATLGGNLATASPIGDSAPVLLALDARLTLASARGLRRLALVDFFTGYRKTALLPGEIIRSVHVPLPVPEHQRFYKVSRRVLDDISTVSAAFALSLDGSRRVEALRVAYGGVAPTPLRAFAVERLAIGKPWSRETLEVLLACLETLATPISDHRGSAAYREAMIRNLLERFFLETEQPGAPS
jgi:xanthine dehydrogenase small subunit